MNKHCVVGAGFAGLPVVKKLLESGDEVVVLDFPPVRLLVET